MAERKLPQFKNEAEEAQWWFDHREEIGQDIVSAPERGALGEGSLARHARRSGAQAAVVALDPEDAERARVQAERRGLEYQEYVKMVVHRALLLEEEGV